MGSFLWNINLEEYIKKINPTIKIQKEFLDYYAELAEIGNRLVSEVNPSNLKSVLAQLMGIDEKCSLVIFYICSEKGLEEWSAIDRIHLIENEYKTTRKEKYLFEMPEYEEWSLAQCIS
ncbi:DUF7006 family protein [Enterococcus sp. LJL99]